MKAHLQEMLDTDAIQKSCSPWTSAVGPGLKEAQVPEVLH